MKRHYYFIISIILICVGTNASAQNLVQGKIITESKLTEKATIILDQSAVFVESSLKGDFRIPNVKKGNHTLTVFLTGYQTQTLNISVPLSAPLSITMSELSAELEEVIVKGEKDNSFGITRLKAIDGTGIYEAKKTEVIVLEDMVANKAANNSRQIFAKIPGANIWESDCAGLQIGVATRGLSPNRNANFNTRQNGFDISADPLGYPESYYTPPIQAVERVELVRGAASLQYGTQFGGLVNFVIKKPVEDKKIALTTEQTYNSLGYYNSYVDAGGTAGNLSYFFFNRTVTGDCWRCNTDFFSTTSYLDIHYQFSDAFKAGVEYTRMNYLAKQPGGLTDQQFTEDPQQSNRERNWFDVDWNLFALHLDYAFSSKLKLNSRTFMLIGSKDALGNLGTITRVDDETLERDLLADSFRNWGNETRLIYHYPFAGQQSALLIGARYYHGFTHRQQGNGPAGSDADFYYLNPDNLEGSDFDLPGINVAAFAENVFNITPKFSITPGIRYEYINTQAEGYYRKTQTNNQGTVISDTTINETNGKARDFVFGGVGASYKISNSIEAYSNFSQNYRSINFNDIRVNNPSMIVDENIKDEFGNNFDLGFRGNVAQMLNFDVSLFVLNYNDKIGTIYTTVVDSTTFTVPVTRTARLRTNIADARTFGVEAFVEANLFQIIPAFKSRSDIFSIFFNLGITQSEYHNSEDKNIEGNQIELVPFYNIKTGVSYQGAKLSGTLQFTAFDQQYSDASNAIGPVPGAVEGLIPSYQVMDFSMQYQLPKGFNAQAGVNNLLNAMYFTRRATGYPGPGIIPSDGRSFYFTLGYRFNQ